MAYKCSFFGPKRLCYRVCILGTYFCMQKVRMQRGVYILGMFGECSFVGKGVYVTGKDAYFDMREVSRKIL